MMGHIIFAPWNFLVRNQDNKTYLATDVCSLLCDLGLCVTQDETDSMRPPESCHLLCLNVLQESYNMQLSHSKCSKPMLRGFDYFFLFFLIDNAFDFISIFMHHKITF